jgi:prepilin-type N-terminal cleavage/methylation domain-containing protein
MNSPQARGFTLIELLVVIAIIAVLSTVVLAFMGNARTGGKDAGVKSNLNNARTQAAFFYDNNNGRFVGTVGSSDDICAPGALVNETKGVYDFVKAAADIAGVNLTTSRTVASSAANPAVCHACLVGDGSCNAASRGNWAALVKMSDGSAFCVDSTGFSGVVAITALAGGDTTCGS